MAFEPIKNKVKFPLFCIAVKNQKVQKASFDDKALFCGGFCNIFYESLQFMNYSNKEYIVWHRFPVVYGIDNFNTIKLLL